MSASKATVRLSPLLSGSVLTLLVLQLGLLWLQGAMLQRQHEDLLALREEVQAMAESLEQGDGWDSGTEEGALSPARLPVPTRRSRFQGVAGRRASRLVPATFLQVQSDESTPAQQELEAARKSAVEAVAKARETQHKLSLPDNLRKAEAQARLEAEAHQRRGQLQRWFGAAAALALLGLAGRAWLRSRG